MIIMVEFKLHNVRRLPLVDPSSSSGVPDLNSRPIDSLCMWSIYHLYHSGMRCMSDRTTVVKAYSPAMRIDFAMQNMPNMNARSLLVITQ
jgi:hypothetical protein